MAYFVYPSLLKEAEDRNPGFRVYLKQNCMMDSHLRDPPEN